MQIGIVSDYYYPQLGGITEQAHGQASELARRGHDVTLITPNLLVTPKTIDSGEPPSEPLFEILKVGRAFPFYLNGSEMLLSISPRLVADLDRIYADRRFDVVHVHNPFGPALPIAGVMRSRAPVTVGTIHSVFPEGFKLLRVFSRPLRRVCRRLDARIAVSAAVVDSIRGHLPDLSFEVIPNGIDTGFFSPAASPLPHLLDGKRNILFIGRFDPRNGLPHMLKAFALLRQRRDDVRLIILGDGPLRRVYQRRVPSELREDVRFEGRVNRLRPRYLASADLLCTPCQLASFGMVLLKAMSAGLPVVARSISGFRLLMQHGVQGLLVEHATDGAGFADALDRLLDDRELARRMGAAGASALSRSTAGRSSPTGSRTCTSGCSIGKPGGGWARWLRANDGEVRDLACLRGGGHRARPRRRWPRPRARQRLCALAGGPRAGGLLPERNLRRDHSLFRTRCFHEQRARALRTYLRRRPRPAPHAGDRPSPRRPQPSGDLLRARRPRAQVSRDPRPARGGWTRARKPRRGSPAARLRRAFDGSPAAGGDRGGGAGGDRPGPSAALSGPARRPRPWLSRTAAGCGYRVCAWHGSVFDTAQPGVTQVVERTCRLLRPGSVVLLHDGDASGRLGSRRQTLAALPAILDEAERRGLRSVPLSSLLRP